MDYSGIICFATFSLIFIFVYFLLCCDCTKKVKKDPSVTPIHRSSVVSHTPLTMRQSICSGDSQSLRSADIVRPIGFTVEVVPSANPPYPVENLMPIPESVTTVTRTQSLSTSKDINPPSYDQVMSNKANYHPGISLFITLPTHSEKS